MKLLLMLGAALTLVACGAQTDPKTGSGSRRASSDASRAIDCHGTAPAALALDGEDLRHVPAEDVRVMHLGTPSSLCDLMRSKPEASLAVFQFASPSCFSCLKWIEAVNAGLAPFGAAVMPIVILTGSSLAVSDADAAELQAQVAAGALWTRDPAGSAWGFFTPSDAPDARVSPVTIVMDGFARGFYVEDPAMTAAQLVEKANKAFTTDVKAATP